MQGGALFWCKTVLLQRKEGRAHRYGSQTPLLVVLVVVFGAAGVDTGHLRLSLCVLTHRADYSPIVSLSVGRQRTSTRIRTASSSPTPSLPASSPPSSTAPTLCIRTITARRAFMILPSRAHALLARRRSLFVLCMCFLTNVARDPNEGGRKCATS